MSITAALLSFCSPFLNFLFLYNCYYKCFLLFYNHHFLFDGNSHKITSIPSLLGSSSNNMKLFFLFLCLKMLLLLNSPLNLLMYDSRLAYSWLWKFFPAFVNIMSYIFIILFCVFPHNYKQIWLLPTQKFFFSCI